MSALVARAGFGSGVDGNSSEVMVPKSSCKLYRKLFVMHIPFECFLAFRVTRGTEDILSVTD